MKFLHFGELLAAGFQLAFDKFQQQQEQRFMALSQDIQDKINSLVQGQQASNDLAQQVIDTVTQETQQVSEAVTTFGTQLTQLNQTLAEKDQIIAQLTQQLADSGQDNTALLAALDDINQKQQAGISALQEAKTKIGDIFTPPTPTEPPVQPV